MSERGMKKWAPYKSLVEHGYALNELSKNKEKVENDIKEINNWVNNFHQTVQSNLKKMKDYVDKKMNNLSSSLFKQINTESNQ